MNVAMRPFAAADVAELALQPSQHVTLGVHKALHSIEDGRQLAALGPAWTAVGGAGESKRVLACYGFAWQFPPSERSAGHALAWAMLAGELGAAHVAITRFARETIAASPIARIEAIVRAAVPAERRWAELVGMTRVALLRAWGPEGEDHLLFERVTPSPDAPVQFRRAAMAPRLEALGAV